MSLHKRHRSFPGKAQASAHASPPNGAEWLVGMGFRCWLAGYDTVFSLWLSWFLRR